VSWRDCTLGDVIKLQRGHDLPERLRRDGSVPVVSSSGVTGRHSEAKAEPPGVVTGRYGTIGEVFFVEEPYWPLNTALYVVDFKGNDPRFVSYLLRNTLRNYQTEKAAVPGVDRNVLHLLKVRAPDRLIQESIVSVLSGYDDLIENNRRRIVLLEEAARMLYREWFVYFRFPGHEHVEIIDDIPQGWAKRPLIDLAEVVMGQSPQSQFYNEIGEGLPFHQGVTNYGFRYVTHRTYSTMVTKIAEAGDILVSVRAPVGRINMTPDKIILGRGLAAIRSRTGRQSYLFYALKNHFYAEDLIGTGAIFAATNKKELEGQLLIDPLLPLIREFEDQAEAIDRQIARLTISNEKLSKARDLLLPRLMNGEIAV
jgi:type I restriction enzyme, S subunit